MLYNDIVIDGMIKRAAYQAAQETVYMMKRAAESSFEGIGTPDLGQPTNPRTALAGLLLKGQDAVNGVINWGKGIHDRAQAEEEAWNNSTEGMLSNSTDDLGNTLYEVIREHEAQKASDEYGDTPVPEPSGEAMEAFNRTAQEEAGPKSKPYSSVADTVFEGATDEDKQNIKNIHGDYKRKAMINSFLEHLGDNKFTYGGGVAGAGIGALLGDSPKSRLLYALLGGGGGAGLGALADHYLK